jgi:hypothetical protein
MRHAVIVSAVLALRAASLTGQVVESVSLSLPQYELATSGRVFLREEANRASFFMLGELHGENEMPELIRSLWPSMWEAGYRHVAAEISPWAAHGLEFGDRSLPIVGLWTRPDVTFVTSLKRGPETVLWGCDIEEVQPHLLISELARANGNGEALKAAVDMVKNGYQRRMAPALLKLVEIIPASADRMIGGISLRDSLVRTLQVEADRFTGAAFSASLRRESVMKNLFHDHWLKAGKPKVFLRFGRNHLHRGIDRRGVPTLGNFVTELAAAERLQVFNVAAFAGGGRIRLLGPATVFDERGDDPAFAYLASVARYPATVFDLRPLRAVLHRLPISKRSAIEASLLYWADSYDAIIFYKEVTPLGGAN